MKETSIYFENAFTQMNWTTMTMKTILTGKNIIDNNLYHINTFDAENCCLLRMMDEENMDFKYFGLHCVENKFADDFELSKSGSEINL